MGCQSTLKYVFPDLLAAWRGTTCKRRKRRERKKTKMKKKGQEIRAEKEKTWKQEKRKERGALNDFLAGTRNLKLRHCSRLLPARYQHCLVPAVHCQIMTHALLLGGFCLAEVLWCRLNEELRPPPLLFPLSLDLWRLDEDESARSLPRNLWWWCLFSPLPSLSLWWRWWWWWLRFGSLPKSPTSERCT